MDIVKELDVQGKEPGIKILWLANLLRAHPNKKILIFSDWYVIICVIAHVACAVAYIVCVVAHILCAVVHILCAVAHKSSCGIA